MKNLLLICLFLSSFYMKCSDNKVLKCSDCYNEESILKAVNKVAERKLGDKIDDFKLTMEEDIDFYIITYINIEYLKDPLKKGGGGFFIKISKEDCKIVDYKGFK